MNVIRPENANRDGTVQAHPPALTDSLRRIGGERTDENSKLDEHRDAARDDARTEGAQTTGDSSRLTNLLFRAGVGATNGSVNGGSAAQKVTNDSMVKVAAKADELNLGPVTAPKNELTMRLSESAQSFASNVDKVVNNHLTQLRSALTAIELQPKETIPHGQLTALNARAVTDAQQVGNVERPVQTHADIANARQVTAGADQQLANNRVLAHPVALDPNTTPVADRGLARLADPAATAANGGKAGNGGIGTIPLDGGANNGAGNANGAAGNANGTGAANQAAGNAAAKGPLAFDRDPTGRFLLAPDSTKPAVSNGEMAKRLQQQDLSKISADQLLSEFLKLNINDPNANVATQDKLYQLASNMRKLAIEEAQKKIRNAEELMKEAQKMADAAEKYANMAGMVGIAAAFMGPLGAILSGIMQIVRAVMQYQAQMKMADAKQEKNNAERFKLMGDMHQNQVEETGDTINKIMELKNQMVDSVINMINASFSTQQQLMSASMAR